MSILKKSTGKKEGKEDCFLGVKIPKEEFSYLSLYSFSTGITKTEIIKNLLRSWIEFAKKQKSTKELIRGTALRALNVWENPEGTRMHFHTFKTQFKIELINRGLKEYTEEILNILTDEKNKKD